MRWILMFGGILCLVGCSVRASLVLNPDGVGRITTEVTLQPEGMDVWNSLRAVDNSLPTDPFDATALSRSLGPKAVVSASSGGVSVSAPLGISGLAITGLTLTNHSWDATVDRAFLRGLAQRTTWGQSPALDTILPPVNVKVSEQDDSDLLVYLLGSKIDEAHARALVKASVFELTITVPRKILSAPGAISVSGDTAVYRWTLTRMLSLTPPIKLHGEY